MSSVDPRDGYVLVHVLEVVVPGRELGENPGCEVALGDVAAGCPVPSTLQSENLALPTGGDTEPVVRVRAFDSRRRAVGMVVVPVNTLVPLEVWNVWYAMDEGEDEEPEVRPPEDTPKMHLLLQYVSGEAAAEETAQLREMRAQDFLLRALQQLNASLEAKVMEHHGRGHFDTSGVDAEPSANGFAMVPAAQPTYPVGNSMSGGATPSQPAPFDRMGMASGQATRGATQPAPLDRMGMAPGQAAHMMTTPSPQGMLPGAYPAALTGSPGSVASYNGHRGAPTLEPQQAPPQAASNAGSVTALPIENGAASGATMSGQKAMQRAQLEEMLRVRVEPYERVIAALEEKQRFYDDQEIRMRVLTQKLEEMEVLNHSLQAKLRDANDQTQAALGVERDLARSAEAERSGLQQKIVELQQEVALRKAHEDSLQRRVALMESELSVLNQKCTLVDMSEQESTRMRNEIAGQKEIRRTMQEQVDEMAKQVAKLQEEACQAQEDHSRQMEKASTNLVLEQQNQERLRQSLQAFQDAARDKDAENRIVLAKNEELTRQVTTLEAEVASYRTMHEREKTHRQELEKRLSEQELAKLSSSLDEHRQTIRGLGDEVSKARQEAMDQRGRVNAVTTELAMVRRELAQERRVGAESRAALAGVEELRSESRSLQEKNEELRAQVKSVQQEVRTITEHYEQVLHERSKQEQNLCKDRDERQQEVAQLRADLNQSQTGLRDLQAEQERLSRTIDIAHQSAERSEDLQRQLQVTQEELRNSQAARDRFYKELEQLSSKFREDTFAQDKRSAELEGALEDRNNEIKLLMYRVQELSSKYVPVKGDPIDVNLSKWVNGYRPAVPFFRLAQGLYLFGRRQVICKLSNDKPVFRVGGGFIGFDKFLELYASEELERLLSYEIDERTGDPKFGEALRVKQAMEDSGFLDEMRERAEMQVRAKEALEPRPGGGGNPTSVGVGAVRRSSPGHYGSDRRRGA